MVISRGNTVGSLTPTQHAILVGGLLGDGTLRKQGTRTNALLEVNHSYKFKDYVDWKYHYFDQYVLTPPKSRRGNGQRIAYRFTTQSLPIFTQYFKWFYREGKKHIPRNIELDPFSLAVWYMDDGSKSREACYLNTQQFTVGEQRFLQDYLNRKFRIDSALNRDKDYFRLRISISNTKRLMQIIRPYVIPRFQYKLVNDPVET